MSALFPHLLTQEVYNVLASFMRPTCFPESIQSYLISDTLVTFFWSIITYTLKTPLSYTWFKLHSNRVVIYSPKKNFREQRTKAGTWKRTSRKNGTCHTERWRRKTHGLVKEANPFLSLRDSQPIQGSLQQAPDEGTLRQMLKCDSSTVASNLPLNATWPGSGLDYQWPLKRSLGRWIKNIWNRFSREQDMEGEFPDIDDEAIYRSTGGHDKILWGKQDINDKSLTLTWHLISGRMRKALFYSAYVHFYRLQWGL